MSDTPRGAVPAGAADRGTWCPLCGTVSADAQASAQQGGDVVGDLVIGARSGAGEPEGSGGRAAWSAEAAAPSASAEEAAAQSADEHGDGTNDASKPTPDNAEAGGRHR